MTLELSELTLYSTAYFSLLFTAAWLADRGWISHRITFHPFTYTLTLGVCASAWAFYGAVGMAYQDGLVFLTLYLGISVVFLLAPWLLSPILRITRDHQLRSLADLFAFRFCSPTVGVCTTLIMLLAMLPLASMQIQAVADSLHILTREGKPEQLAAGFCIIITLFTIAFGTRRISSRKENNGLVFAIALDSFVKLVAILAFSGTILSEVFGSLPELKNWLRDNHTTSNLLQITFDGDLWATMLLVSFAAATVMPGMFHMTFTERQNNRDLNRARWGLPVYLLLMSLPVPLILWGALKLTVSTTPEYFALGIGLKLGSPLMILLVYTAAISAAGGVIIVTIIALSGMVMNHLILPVYQPPKGVNIYRWLNGSKRVLIAFMMLVAYGFYRMLEAELDLTTVVIVSFIGGLQFLPGLLATIYWPRANHYGFLAGLGVGSLIWFVTLLIPLVRVDDVINITGLSFTLQGTDWHGFALASFIVNSLVLVIVSLTTEGTAEEKNAARICSARSFGHSARHPLQAASSLEFQKKLSPQLGQAAQNEVFLALRDLDMSPDENRPYALRRLREQIEANLSSLMGPSVSKNIINRCLICNDDYAKNSAKFTDINHIENQIDECRYHFTGLAAELDTLRRYHRQILQSLPMAACSFGEDGEILMWNQAMTMLTGISDSISVGGRVDCLSSPWQELLTEFLKDYALPGEQKHLSLNGQPRVLNLQKSFLEAVGNTVIVIEDQTEFWLMEQKLMHSERLASIGQLAAGVAHEIGNPVTGIDCLAQELRSLSDNEEIQEVAEEILAQTQRIARILRSLINFAHKDQPTLEKTTKAVNLYDCADEAIGLMVLGKTGRNIRFINNCDPHHLIIGDGQKIIQILINLLGNAQDASLNEAEIYVSTNYRDHTVILEVTDQGCGIPEEHQNKIFEPFFTTKGVGKGTGLGMALVYSIVEEHFGTISVRSPVNTEERTGTTISISLPEFRTISDTDTNVSPIQSVPHN